MINDTQAVKYETGIKKFTIYANQIQVPFKIYAGTECLLKRVNINKGKYTKLYQKHIPNSIGAKLVCVDSTFFLDTIIYTGKDCINKFIKWIFKMKGYCNQLINNYFNEKLQMSLDDEERYQNSQICWICKEKLNTEKKRDHCHITGKFRGAAHNKCNLKVRIPRKLPIIFHNLEAYEGHIIFKELNNFNDINIQVIPKTSEKYLSMIVNGGIIFLNSNQFYKGKLDNHASHLNNEDFKHLLSEFCIDKLELLKGKDTYPY